MNIAVSLPLAEPDEKKTVAGTAAVAEPDEKETITRAATTALEAANGDTHKAAEILADRVRKNAKLRDALLAPLIGQACAQAINLVVRTERNRIWSPPVPRDEIRIVPPKGEERASPAKSGGRVIYVPPTPPAPGPSHPARVKALASSNLLMFPLPGGKPLGTANRIEVMDAAVFYEKQATDMGHKSRWLRKVGEALKDEERVAEVLDERRLSKMQEATRHG